MKPLLEIKDLKVTFSTLSKKVRAVRGVTLQLNEGEILGIVGESGSGKSVLVKSLTRLLPKTTASIEGGEILYKGCDLLKLKERELKKVRGKEIGMIFQDPTSSLNPTMRIKEQITEGLKIHYPKMRKREREERALDLLKKVRVSEPELRLQQYPHELSGGMRQRIMIAISMILSPKILIADEPTTALDVTIEAQILYLLKEMREKEGLSLIFITHDLGIVANFCDRVLVMYAGQIVESAPVEELFYQPKHPYTRRLLKSIPRLDLPAERMLYSIKGSPPDLSQPLKGCPFAERCPHKTKHCTQKEILSTAISENHFVSCTLFEKTPKEEEALF